ncbi:hypothetical protein ACWKWN_08705 [Microbacterium trichothecenolyticum]
MCRLPRSGASRRGGALMDGGSFCDYGYHLWRRFPFGWECTVCGLMERDR